MSRLGRADAARRRCGPTGFALVVASLLAGCSTTPGPASRLPLLPDLAQSALLAASSSTPAPAPPPAAEIVRVSHDAEGPADPGPTFTLADAVGFALANSPRLRMAQAAVERAGGQEEEAFAPFLPQVGLLNRYGGTNAPLSPGAPGLTGAILPTVNGAHTFLQSELQLQWTLYDFGRTGGRHRQAVARERMAELRLARALETVAYDTATAYLDALLAASVRIIREESIRRAEATLSDVRSRRAAGVADRDDVLRAEVQLSEAREGLVLAQESEYAALARLNTVMGRSVGLPIRLVELPGEAAGFPDLTQALETAAAQRPEIGVARQSVAAAQAGRQAAAGEFLPRIYVLASLGRVGGENVYGGWQEGAGLHLVQPVFAGGAHRGRLHAAAAEVQEAVASAQSVLDQVSLEVVLAWRGAESARKRIDLARPAVEEARENLRLVRNKYRNGNATPTDIVDGETALTRAQQRLASAAYEYLAALVRLAYATGSPQGKLCAAADQPEGADASPGGAPPGLTLPAPETLPAPRPLPETR